MVTARDEEPAWAEDRWDDVAAAIGLDAVGRLDRWDDAVATHHPVGPHWYLGVLAAAPAHQGRGHGPAVARPGLEAAAAAGLPAFLETGADANVARYERLGFVVTGTIDSPDLPRGWCMVKD